MCSIRWRPPAFPDFPAETPTSVYLGTMSNTKTFGPTIVNEFRLSFFRTKTIVTKPAGSFAKLSDLGFVTGVGTLGIIPSGPAGFPETVPPLYFNNFSIGVPTLTTLQPNNTWMVSDGFSKVFGKHSLKVGGEFRYLQINERNTCAPNGDFTFSGLETGIDFADFLLGRANGRCSLQPVQPAVPGFAHALRRGLRAGRLQVETEFHVESGRALGSEHALV